MEIFEEKIITIRLKKDRKGHIHILSILDFQTRKYIIQYNTKHSKLELMNFENVYNHKEKLSLCDNEFRDNVTSRRCILTIKHPQ